MNRLKANKKKRNRTSNCSRNIQTISWFITIISFAFMMLANTFENKTFYVNKTSKCSTLSNTNNERNIELTFSKKRKKMLMTNGQFSCFTHVQHIHTPYTKVFLYANTLCNHKKTIKDA